MIPASAYRFDVGDQPTERWKTHAAEIFAAAWRSDFSAPGFALIDLGAGMDSLTLRGLMVALKDRLGAIKTCQTGTGFGIRSLGRFDQQATTRFHLDGAPDRSLLMLGYEPSLIASRLSLADYTREAHQLGLDPRQFLDDYNPMYRAGEDRLAASVTILPQPAPGVSWILLINNSRLPWNQERTHPLGVLHKAEILNPDASQPRIVNSMLLTGEGPDEVDAEQVQEFLTSDVLSRKIAG